ncbi:MAG: DUF1318 domain-containing protein [Gammaproteobacteria bacterium]|nr:MAG: DUF1318 domain-containing protein [Gammaproteobacteria bacterium]
MNRIKTIIAVWPLVLLGSCVTINVYFPAAAAEKAADRIIEEVWGKDAQPAKDAPASDKQSRIRSPQGIGYRLLAVLIPSAHAQAPDLDITSPAIAKIQGAMKSRHGELVRFYDLGAAGLSNNGLIGTRDPRKVPLKERRRLAQLVAAENRDRAALYREIARANGHPEWEADIRRTFARRWVSRARGGWWYQDSSGNWRQK